MPVFEYSGRTARGEAVSGRLEADSADALANQLFSRGITPIGIEPALERRDVLKDLWRRLGGGRPQLVDLIMFSRQMHALTQAGLPLLRGMQSLVASTPNVYLSEALASVLDTLRSGRDLATALGRHPDVFSKFYVSVVRVGETSGTLPTAFERMYEYLSMEQRIREKLGRALRYPLLVVVAIGVAIAVITLWVLPQFEPVFAALGDDIPWATRMLLGVSGFASAYWYAVLAAAFAGYIGFRLYVRDERGRYKWDRFKLRVPVTGSIVQKATLARICRSFALTFEAGVPMVQGLNLIARAAGNDYLSERVLALRDGIEHGESLTRTAATVGVFSPLALQMVSIGEETGDLGPMLTEVADFYEREVDYELDHLSAALEPLLIVGVGVMVLILALGVFLPLWDMAARSGGFG